MAELFLEAGTMWSLLQVSLSLLVYALIVNLFYQVVSKRRMFASKRDVVAERVIDDAMSLAMDSAKEAEELSNELDVGDDPSAREQRQAAADDASREAEVATEQAVSEIKRQVLARQIWVREMRALVLFPLVTSLFFLLLSANLIFIGADRPPIEVYTLALAIILAVRIAAYISEATSHDLAKLLPLALLGFYLVEGGFGGIKEGNDALWALRDELGTVVGFIAVITVVEVVLRISYLALKRLRWAAWLQRKAKRLG